MYLLKIGFFEKTRDPCGKENITIDVVIELKTKNT